MKSTPNRMCVCCRQMKPQKEMLRVVKTKDGQVFVDKTGKASGRGSYICSDKECIAKAKKTRAFDRAYKMKLDDEFYLQIEKELTNEQN